MRKHLNRGNGLADVTRQAMMKKAETEARAALGVVLSNQGAMLVQLGRPAEALRLLKRASEYVLQQQRDTSRRAHGAPSTVDAVASDASSTRNKAAAAAKANSASLLNNTAAAYLTLGNAARAAELLASPDDDAGGPPPSSASRHQRLLRYRLNPEVTKLMASSLSNLAQAQSRAGHHRPALASSWKAVALLENLADEPTFGLAVALNTAAAVLAAAQRPEHALPAYDRCVAILEFLVDDAHPLLQSCVAARAACLVAAGRGAEATREMARALRLAEKRWARALEDKTARNREESERAAAAAEGRVEKGAEEEEEEHNAEEEGTGEDAAAAAAATLERTQEQEGDAHGASPPMTKRAASEDAARAAAVDASESSSSRLGRPKHPEDRVATADAAAPDHPGQSHEGFAGIDRVSIPVRPLVVPCRYQLRREDEDAAAAVLHCQTSLANLLYAQGHHAESLALHESALGLTARMHGEASDEVVAGYNSLAVTCAQRGMRDKALALVRERMALAGRGHDARLVEAAPPVGQLSPWYHAVGQ